MEVTETTRIYYIYIPCIPNNEFKGVFLNKKDALKKKSRITQVLRQDPEYSEGWPQLESKTVEEFLRMFENDEDCCEEGCWSHSYMKSTYLWKKIRYLPVLRARQQLEQDDAQTRKEMRAEREYFKRKMN